MYRTFVSFQYSLYAKDTFSIIWVTDIFFLFFYLYFRRNNSWKHWPGLPHDKWSMFGITVLAYVKIFGATGSLVELLESDLHVLTVISRDRQNLQGKLESTLKRQLSCVFKLLINMVWLYIRHQKVLRHPGFSWKVLFIAVIYS